MKLLAVFFLLGLALASAVPLSFDDLESEIDEITDELGDEFIVYAEGGLAQRLRERLEQLIEKIKNKFDEGQSVDGNLMKKAQDFYEKLKNLGFEIGEKFQKIFEELKEKIRGGNSAPEYVPNIFFCRLLNLREKLRGEFDVEKIRDHIRTIVGGTAIEKSLLEMTNDKEGNGRQKILHMLHLILDNRKTQAAESNAPEYVPNLFLCRLFDLREKLQNEFDVEKIRDHIQTIMGTSSVANTFLEMTKAGNGREKILNIINLILGAGNREPQVAHSEFFDRIKQQFEQLVEKIKKSFEEGNGINEKLMEKAKDFYERLQKYGVEVSDRIKEIFEDLKNRMNKINPEQASFNFKDLLSKLRERLQGEFDVEKVRDQIENLFGKSEITNQLLDIIKDKGGKAKQRILEFIDRILGDKETQAAESGFLARLREQFEQLVEKMKKSFDEGKGVSENMMKKAQDFYEKLKNLGVEVSDKIKEIFEDLKNKMSKNNPEQASFNFKDLLSKLRERLQGEFDVEKVRDQIENLFGKSEITNQLLDIIKDKGGKAKKRILEFIDRILGDKETQAAEFGFLARLREQFEQLVEKMKKSFDEGKGVSENMMKKAQDFYDKLSNLGVEISDKVKEIFEDLKNKMSKNSVEHAEGGIVSRIRERLENLINRMKKNFDDGKGVSKNHMKKANDIYEKFKNLGFELSEKFKSIFEDLRSKLQRTRSVENADFNFFEIFRKLKQLIKDKVDADDLKTKVENLFGKGSEIAEQLINMLKEKGGKGKNKILDWIDRVLGEKEEKRSIKEIYEKVKNYFKDLNIELKEKFVNFGQYVKDQYQKVLDKSKTKAENVKEIAKKFLDDGKKLSKDLAEEALEFFREYKNDLGIVWDDVRDKVQDILKRKD